MNDNCTLCKSRKLGVHPWVIYFQDKPIEKALVAKWIEKYPDWPIFYFEFGAKWKHGASIQEVSEAAYYLWEKGVGNSDIERWLMAEKEMCSPLHLTYDEILMASTVMPYG